MKAAVCVNRVMSVFLSLNTDSLIWRTGGWRGFRIFHIHQNKAGLIRERERGEMGGGYRDENGTDWISAN